MRWMIDHKHDCGMALAQWQATTSRTFIPVPFGLDVHLFDDEPRVFQASFNIKGHYEVCLLVDGDVVGVFNGSSCEGTIAWPGIFKGSHYVELQWRAVDGTVHFNTNCDEWMLLRCVKATDFGNTLMDDIILPVGVGHSFIVFFAGRVVHIDDQKGSDETGIGTVEHPYASLNPLKSIYSKKTMEIREINE